MAKKHKSHDHEEHMDETWLIPYADLLTLLLALFIVLFASSQVDAKKFEKMSESLNSAFDGGLSFFEETSPVEPVTESMIEKPDNGQGEMQGISNEDKENKDKDDSTSPQKDPSIAELIKKETEDLRKLQQQIDQYIKENNLNTKLETVLNNRQLTITIRDNALFQSGSAIVKPEAQQLAGAISNLLVQYPQYEIEVGGHTDNRPINTVEFSSNWELSTERSLNFMNFLLKNPKLNPAVFKTIGYGEYRPVETNETAQGRSQNRRVEISIMRRYLEQAAQIEAKG